jgi:glycosyltransferase involved in cell wall biosynthesis
MGKNNKKKQPLVSICTPTFNRRPFLETAIQCFCNQTYPRDRMEWIIVDDGTDSVEDVFKSANIPQVKYFRLDKKMTLGAKRNYTHSKCSGSIIVYMDDDDYYPPERVSHAVETLQKNPNALCAGSSEIYVYFKHLPKMYQGGPYGPNHATAGTFAFRKELLNQTKYNENASLAEEKEFLKNYTVPFVQLDPLKTILVFSHIQNTFDKRKLLENPNQMFKPSDKTIEMFIKHSYEKNIQDFFLKDIDKKLEKYKHGDPIMKPDVLKQIKELEAEREKMRKNMGQIMLQQPGKDPRPMTSQELVQLIQKQQQDIKTLNEKVQELSKGPPYEELDNRARKIQMLEGLVTRLREELQSAKNVQPKEESSPIPTPPPVQVDPIQSISFAPLPMSKLVPEVIVTAPIVSV